MFKYFISFNCNSKSGNGFGNTEIITDMEIRGINDVNEIGKKIGENKSVNDVVIINFIRLS